MKGSALVDMLRYVKSDVDDPKHTCTASSWIKSHAWFRSQTAGTEA